MALKTDLVSVWELDEASGNALDSHGSNTLTQQGSVGASSGKCNGARSFGGNNFFSMSDNSSVSVTDSIDFMFSCWVNAPSFANSRGIISKYTGEYTLWTAGSTFVWFLGSGALGSGSVSSTNFGTPSANQWCFIVVWHDSVNNQIGIRVNNGTANTASYSAGISDGTAGFRIGDVNGFTWEGLIDQVAFWKRLLTNDEQAEIYNSGNGLPYSSWDAGGGGTVVPTLDGRMFAGGFLSMSGGLS